VLSEKQLKHAATADLIIRSLAKIGIIALIDESCGYQEFRDKTALQSLLDKYLNAESAKWAKTFPDTFYLGMFKLKNWNTERVLQKKPMIVAKYTNDLIYKRLAPGLLESLEERNPMTETGKRKNRHFQFLTHEQGLAHLKGHLFMVQKIMKMSKNWEDFMEKMDALLPYATTEDLEIDVT
jgi:P63C domain-containing protein